MDNSIGIPKICLDMSSHCLYTYRHCLVMQKHVDMYESIKRQIRGVGFRKNKIEKIERNVSILVNQNVKFFIRFSR